MTGIEILMPFLVAALFVGVAVLGGLCARTECRLASRKRITLDNYKLKNNLFYVTKDIPVAVLAAATMVIDVALLIVTLTQPVIRLYAIALAVMLPAQGVIGWLSFSRDKCARDLHLFDAYHVRVQDLLRSKERLEREITVCRRRADDLKGKLTATLGGFNQNLAHSISDRFVNELFAPLDEMLSDYLSDIAKFSTEIETAFNRALQEFLLENTEPQLNILPLRTFDETVVDDLLASIKTTFGARIAGIVVEEVGQGAVKSAVSLGNIMNLLHGLEVRVEGDVLARFLTAAEQFDDREDLARLLYANKQIPAALLTDTLIPQNVEWVFVAGMNGAYNTRELTAVLAAVLQYDRREMCRRLLADAESTDLPVLDSVIAAERVRNGGKENNACRLAAVYRLILSNAFAVGNSANLSENMAQMLYDRREETGLNEAEQEAIAEICRTERYAEAAKEIAAYYQKATDYGAPLVASATHILLFFLTCPAGNGKLLRGDLLAKLLGEYRFTLSFEDLNTMRTLLGGITLMSEQDRDVQNAVLAEFAAVPGKLELPASVTDGNASRIGQQMLHYLTQNDRVRLRSVVYRTEAARRTLDHIVRV